VLPDDGDYTETCWSRFNVNFNPLNSKLNPICHLLALLGAHPSLHVSRIRVNTHFKKTCASVSVRTLTISKCTVRLCTKNRSNCNKDYILPTSCVYVFRMVLVMDTGICTNNINGLVFVMDKQCVFSELRTKG
jgi:hypothetical protein